jgi:hypothetical protein
MADTKISALDAVTALALTDLIPVVVDLGGTPTTKKVTYGNFAIWTAYNPVWTATGGTTTLGNGSLIGRYCQIGKLVIAKINLVWGSTTSCTGAAWKFTTPVNDANAPRDVGSIWMLDNGTSYIGGVCVVETGANYIRCFAPTAGELTSSVPFTWTTGDKLALTISYEAA